MEELEKYIEAHKLLKNEDLTIKELESHISSTSCHARSLMWSSGDEALILKLLDSMSVYGIAMGLRN